MKIWAKFEIMKYEYANMWARHLAWGIQPQFSSPQFTSLANAFNNRSCLKPSTNVLLPLPPSWRYHHCCFCHCQHHHKYNTAGITSASTPSTPLQPLPLLPLLLINNALPLLIQPHCRCCYHQHHCYYCLHHDHDNHNHHHSVATVTTAATTTTMLLLSRHHHHN